MHISIPTACKQSLQNIYLGIRALGVRWVAAMEAVAGVALAVRSGRGHLCSSQLILATRVCSIQDRGLVDGADVAWYHTDSILFSVVAARRASTIRAQKSQYRPQVDHTHAYRNEVAIS